MLDRLTPLSSSSPVGRDRAMIGLGDKKGAVGPGRSYRLAPPLDLRRCQCGEYLLLVTLDALRAGYDRNQLQEASESGQSKRSKAQLLTSRQIADDGTSLPRGPAAGVLSRIELSQENFHGKPANPDPVTRCRIRSCLATTPAGRRTAAEVLHY